MSCCDRLLYGSVRRADSSLACVGASMRGQNWAELDHIGGQPGWIPKYLLIAHCQFSFRHQDGTLRREPCYQWLCRETVG